MKLFLSFQICVRPEVISSSDPTVSVFSLGEQRKKHNGFP